MRNIVLYLNLIAAFAFCGCSGDSGDENGDVLAVYRGTLNIVSSGYSHISPDVSYPPGIENIPFEIKEIKDTLIYEGTTTTSEHCTFTLTVKENSSILEILESFDGDSLFYWYTKETIVYKEGSYTASNNKYEFKVIADGIYISNVGDDDARKQLCKKLTNYSEIKYIKTDKSENRQMNDITSSLLCSDNSLQYVDEKRKYKAIINDSTCILYQLSPDKYEIKLHKMK